MVGGGLMQLVAYGVQDVYLNNNAIIPSYFQIIYRRHTNFSMDEIQQQNICVYPMHPNFTKYIKYNNYTLDAKRYALQYKLNLRLSANYLYKHIRRYNIVMYTLNYSDG